MQGNAGSWRNDGRPLTADAISGEFGSAWKGFVAALRRLLTAPPSERRLDAFLTLRNATLNAFEDPGMIADLQSAWFSLHAKQQAPYPAHLLLMELLAFPVALDLKAAGVKICDGANHPWKRFVGIGGAVVDNVHDVLNDLPPVAKGVLKEGRELLDVFRGD